MAGGTSAERVESGARLREGALDLGVDLDDAAVTALCRFLDELEVWNARTNLVGEHDRRSLIDRHLVDALAAVPVLRPLGPRLRMADLGSGGGLPGVPLAIALRPRDMWLIEPRKKRASFLRSVRRALPDVALQVVEDRGEDMAARPDLHGSFDAVVSRATLGDAELQACAAPLLRDGGLLVAYRGVGAAPVVDRGSDGPAPFTGPVAHPYRLSEARRAFRLDVWTRCFT